MIKKIILAQTASYKEETSLETDKKINLIYGLNGSGKTVFSNYLKNPEDKNFSNCSINGLETSKQKILVYNQKFVEENFYESDKQKGIFTLTQENKVALEAIKSAQEEQKRLLKKINDDEDGYSKKLKEKKNAMYELDKNIKNKTWEIKTEYAGGDRVFDEQGFLDGFKNSKDEMLKHIMGYELSETTKTIDDIKKELLRITDTEALEENLDPINHVSLVEIEKNNIFQKKIEGSNQTPISALIKELQNSHWVKKGIEHYVDLNQRNKCPFCQEETLTEELINNIRDCFDKTYEDDVNNIKRLKKEYHEYLEGFNCTDYIKDFFTKEQGLSITILFKNLSQICNKNSTLMDKKIAQPNLPIALASSEESINNINQFIEKINQEIATTNHKITNQEEEKEKLKKEFWKALRKQYTLDIENYENRIGQLENEKKYIEDKITNVNELIQNQKGLIIKNQEQTTNIEGVINKINEYLLDFGIQDFQIKEHNDQEYQICRDGTNSAIFRSLSEGEKTVISFLYFIELCEGKESMDDIKEKIIVIDDPVSSLSHMYIFNIAVLIKSCFFEKDKSDFVQIFILTHNLYFFNELFNRKKIENKKLFRITKNHCSSIHEMRKNEIENEYQSYWTIIKDGDKDTHILIANAMRNIIEYFFGFIDKSKSINNIFQKSELSHFKYNAFKRYMDRESHSTPDNIFDTKDFNYEDWKKLFKEVFEKTGYSKHYESMIR